MCADLEERKRSGQNQFEITLELEVDAFFDIHSRTLSLKADARELLYRGKVLLGFSTPLSCSETRALLA